MGEGICGEKKKFRRCGLIYPSFFITNQWKVQKNGIPVTSYAHVFKPQTIIKINTMANSLNNVVLFVGVIAVLGIVVALLVIFIGFTLPDYRESGKMVPLNSENSGGFGSKLVQYENNEDTYDCGEHEVECYIPSNILRPEEILGTVEGACNWKWFSCENSADNDLVRCINKYGWRVLDVHYIKARSLTGC